MGEQYVVYKKHGEVTLSLSLLFPQFSVKWDRCRDEIHQVLLVEAWSCPLDYHAVTGDLQNMHCIKLLYTEKKNDDIRNTEKDFSFLCISLFYVL